MLEKLALIEKFLCSGKEEVRPKGGDTKKSRKESPANHIAWINLVVINFEVLVFCWGRFAQESYIYTCST